MFKSTSYTERLTTVVRADDLQSLFADIRRVKGRVVLSAPVQGGRAYSVTYVLPI